MCKLFLSTLQLKQNTGEWAVKDWSLHPGATSLGQLSGREQIVTKSGGHCCTNAFHPLVHYFRTFCRNLVASVPCLHKLACKVIARHHNTHRTSAQLQELAVHRLESAWWRECFFRVGTRHDQGAEPSQLVAYWPLLLVFAPVGEYYVTK